MTVSADYAEAKKRFGGGGSFGKMFSTPKKAAPAPSPSKNTAQPTNNQTTTTAAKPKPGMGGLMGGLLAGGILGALFFGGAFEGIQMMDILIIAVIAFILFRFLGRMKQPQQKPQYAGGYEAPQQEQQPQQRSSVEPQSSGFEPTPLMSNSLAEAQLELPAWFDKEAFLAGAREHFVHLQSAWNSNDLEEIQTYCEADFYQMLVAERAKLGSETLDNEVVSVMVELLGFNEFDDRAELSINFYGWMREGTGAQTSEFNEIWHLSRDTSSSDADWFIVGIEQP
jgi:predicted lipid-binding transport protein (Tim44 family)